MSLRAQIRDDPTTRRILQSVVAVVIILAAVTPSQILYYGVMSSSLPYWMEKLFDTFLTDPLGLPANITGMIVGVAPVVLAGVCYRSEKGSRKLTRFGMICAVLATYGLVVGLITFNFLDSVDIDSTHLGGKQLILNIQTITTLCLHSCLFYIALLVGISGAGQNE